MIELLALLGILALSWGLFITMVLVDIRKATQGKTHTEDDDSSGDSAGEEEPQAASVEEEEEADKEDGRVAATLEDEEISVTYVKDD